MQFLLYVIYIYLAYIYLIMNFYFEQIDFDPESIGFKSFPIMSKHIVDAMLPGQHGEVHKISMHEGGIFDIFLHI